MIHMNNVLEHIPDPHQFLMLAYEILKPAGLICITVPNDYNPLQKVVVTYLKKILGGLYQKSILIILIVNLFPG